MGGSVCSWLIFNMKMIDYIKKNALALWVSIIYVVLGGIVACSIYPDDPLSGNWWIWGWLITLPVNLFSSAYRFAIGAEYFPVIIIQIILLVPTFILISKIVVKKRTKRSDAKN
jgi:hypothetical protein